MTPVSKREFFLKVEKSASVDWWKRLGTLLSTVVIGGLVAFFTIDAARRQVTAVEDKNAIDKKQYQSTLVLNLIPHLLDSKPEHRKLALAALQAGGNQTVLDDVLTDVALHDDDASVRQAAINQLGNSYSPKALRTLGSISQDETRPAEAAAAKNSKAPIYGPDIKEYPFSSPICTEHRIPKGISVTVSLAADWVGPWPGGAIAPANGDHPTYVFVRDFVTKSQIISVPWGGGVTVPSQLMDYEVCVVPPTGATSLAPSRALRISVLDARRS